MRVALWRALHVQVDPPPHVFADEIGLQLAAPDGGWQRCPDMAVKATRRARASIVARVRVSLRIWWRRRLSKASAST